VIKYAAILWMILTMPAMSEEVSLLWNKSITPTVTGYKIYVGNSSRNYRPPITIGNQDSYTITSLTSGTYFFAVSAFDGNGNESVLSNEVSQVISTGGVLPVTIQIGIIPAPGPQIRQIMVTYLTTSSAMITWETTAECSGKLFYGTAAPSPTGIISNNQGTTDHVVQLTGLTRKTRYVFKVQSLCGDTEVDSDVRSFNTKN
jgi:hypothetical protein